MTASILKPRSLAVVMAALTIAGAAAAAEPTDGDARSIGRTRNLGTEPAVVIDVRSGVVLEPEAWTDQNGVRLRVPSAASGVSRNIDRQAAAPPDADWTALGPAGGDVLGIAVSPVDPSIVLAGTAPSDFGDGRLYRSTDGGLTWTTVPEVDNDIFDIVFTDAGTAYAATRGSVWKSTDHGASWERLDLGIDLGEDVRDLALDPSAPETLWAGIAGAANIKRSEDGGASWVDLSTPVKVHCTGIAVDPHDSDRVFAVLGDGFTGEMGVWFSSDGGLRWLDRSAGLPDNPMHAVLFDGSRVVVAGGDVFASRYLGVYASTDDGLTWSALHDGSWPLLAVNDLAVDPNDPNFLLAATGGTGLHLSTDGGATWELSIGDTEDLSLNRVHYAPASTPVFIGAGSFAVLQCPSLEDPFVPTSRGISELYVFSIAANPTRQHELAIAFQGLNDGGVYTSVDSGQTWTPEPVPLTRYNDVVFDPAGTLYAVSGGPSTIAPEGLYRREKNGTWTSLGPDQGSQYETDLWALRFSENDPHLIMTGGNDFGDAGFRATIWRSTDAGNSWSKVFRGTIDFEEVKDIEIVEDGTDTIMLASTWQYGYGQMLRSSDGGLSWHPSSSGLPASFRSHAFCPSAGNVNTFFVADEGESLRYNGGLHQTTDAGFTWFNTGYENQEVHDVVCDAHDDRVLYIAQRVHPQILRSEDAGATFAPFDNGLGTASTILDLAWGGDEPPTLLLATSTGSFSTELDSSFALSAAGTCPGEVTVSVSNALPDHRLLLWAGPFEGTSTVGWGSCAGTPLDLAFARFWWRLFTDENGDVSLTGTLPEIWCGRVLQALDRNCTTSNTAQIPMPADGARVSPQTPRAPPGG